MDEDDGIPLCPDGRPRPGRYEKVHLGMVRWRCTIAHDANGFVVGERVRLTWLGWLTVIALIVNLIYAFSKITTMIGTLRLPF